MTDINLYLWKSRGQMCEWLGHFQIQIYEMNFWTIIIDSFDGFGESLLWMDDILDDLYLGRDWQ